MALPELPQLGIDETRMNDPKIIVALDYPDPRQALEFSAKINPSQCRLKIGKELFTAAGPRLAETLIEQGFDIFLDLKFHDIPNTVRRATAAAARLGVWMLDVHALGGEAMMQAAREGAETVARRPLLLGVTVLTSTSAEDLQRVGIDTPIPRLVDRLAHCALDSGLDGVVCSAREASALRASLGAAAFLVTPGIRPEWAASNDQRRIVTPERALADGANYLVIGRPITQHENPARALELISDSIAPAA